MPTRRAAVTTALSFAVFFGRPGLSPAQTTTPVQVVPAQITPAQPAPAAPPATRPPALEGGRIYSMGQPPKRYWQGSLLYDTHKEAGFAAVSTQRNLGNPLAGMLAVRAEALVGASREGAEASGRLLLSSPLLGIHLGVDYDVREDVPDFLFGWEVGIRRGGLFGHGTRLRFGWMPWRNQDVQVGLSIPVGQRAGSTRPKSDKLKVSETRLPAPRPAPGEFERAIEAFGAAAVAVARLVIPLHENMEGDMAKSVAADAAAVNRLEPPERVLQRMVDAWPALFSAAGAGGDDPAGLQLLARRARRIVLEDAILPFDGLLGERRTKGSLYVFADAARQRFAAEVATAGLSGQRREAAMTAFYAAFAELDRVRAAVREDWREDRRVFLPLQLALAPDEADTQSEIDALVERATASRFSDHNRIYYVINEAFQFEFARTVRLAEKYHVLWIHDVQGRSPTSPIDRVSARHAVNYLDTMADRIRRYDETGTLPEYHIILDQFFYEGNKGRIWMTLLENPLGYEFAYPAQNAKEEASLRAAQQSLRDAVAGSKRLQAQRAEYGEAWLRRLVKVHVSITHPSDFSFWGRGLIPILGMPDNLMRDHRKLAFYDLVDDDPSSGEVIFSGMGLGEHYSGATWEDRALIVKGPAALGVRDEAWRLFQRQGFDSVATQGPARPQPRAGDFDERYAAGLQRMAAEVGVPARVLQSHNDVGFGRKQASVGKAILLSVMPPGSVLIAPDSLWESVLWGSLLTGSALRGCRVLVIAPSFANAPGTGFLTVTRTHVVLSRMLALSKAIEAPITAAGGLLRIGLFNEQSEVGDFRGRGREMTENFAAAKGWFGELVPFPPATTTAWRAAAEEIAQSISPGYLVDETGHDRPKLHMKGLFAASRDAWDSLFGLPEVVPVLREYTRQRARQVSGEERDVRGLPEAMWKFSVPLMDAHQRSLTDAQRTAVVRYLQIGSFNMNDRSMLLDGEVTLTVSGVAAGSGMLDFIAVAGLTRWIERQEDLDALLPPPSSFKRLLARWGRNVI
jgi:hypothetical protein